MDLDFEHLYDLKPEARAKLLESLEKDPPLRRDYVTWLGVSSAIRRELADAVGEDETFILFALDRAGRSNDLSLAEREKVDMAREHLGRVVGQHPGLADVARQIQTEADQFDTSWRVATMKARTATADRADRSVRLGRPQGSRYVRFVWRGAAVVAALTFIGILMLVARKDSNRIIIGAEDGLIRQVDFADGSTMRLVGPAEVSYSRLLAEAERPQVIRLAGHAYFDVVARETPFVVETATARVSVLGTNFGMRAERDRTEVILASGQLAVASRDRPSSARTISAGQSCTVDRGGLPGEPVAVDLTEALAWANLFVFRGTLMTRVASVLSEHYGASVEIDPSLASQRIHGTFDRQQNLMEILTALATTLSAEATQVGDSTYTVLAGG